MTIGLLSLLQSSGSSFYGPHRRPIWAALRAAGVGTCNGSSLQDVAPVGTFASIRRCSASVCLWFWVQLWPRRFLWRRQNLLQRWVSVTRRLSILDNRAAFREFSIKHIDDQGKNCFNNCKRHQDEENCMYLWRAAPHINQGAESDYFQLFPLGKCSC